MRTKNKFVTLLFAIAMTATLAVSFAAQPKLKFVVVNLKCTINGPSEFPTVTIYNTSTDTIKSGQTINWSANNVMKGSYKLQADLAPGSNVHFSEEAAGTIYTPKAWYLKSVTVATRTQ